MLIIHKILALSVCVSVSLCLCLCLRLCLHHRHRTHDIVFCLWRALLRWRRVAPAGISVGLKECIGVGRCERVRGGEGGDFFNAIPYRDGHTPAYTYAPNLLLTVGRVPQQLPVWRAARSYQYYYGFILLQRYNIMSPPDPAPVIELGLVPSLYPFLKDLL